MCSSDLRIARLRDHWLLDQVLVNAADLALNGNQTEGAHALLTEAHQRLESRYPLAKDTAEQWRYAVWDSVNAQLMGRQQHPDDASAIFFRAREVLVKRFGSQGFYVLRLDQRRAGLDRGARITSSISKPQAVIASVPGSGTVVPTWAQPGGTPGNGLPDESRPFKSR